MNILLADGIARSHATWRAALEALGHQVTEADSPESAFEAFARVRHEVVICDDGCPPPGGMALGRRIRSVCTAEGAYLILQCRHHGLGGRASALELGVDDLIAETAQEDELIARLLVAGHTLRRRRADADLWTRVVRIPTDCPFPILEMSPEGDLLHSNPAAVLLLEAWGWNPGQTTPAPLRGIVLSARAAGEDTEAELPCGERTYRVRAINLDDGGVTLYAHESIPQPLTQDETGSTPAGGLILSRRDTLTGLPPRLQFLEHLQRTVDMARHAGTGLILAKVNIDNCREINESLGPASGDEAIRLVAECLTEQLREGDASCREFGDQFILLLQHPLADGTDFDNLHARLKRLIAERSASLGLATCITISAGLTRFPEDADSAKLLAEYADLSLAEAKRSGRDCWRDFASVAKAHPWVRGGRFLPRLIKALHEKRLQAHFQPIIRAADGEIAGFEALARWHDSEFGWVPPNQFIAVAEARGLISEVGRLMAAQSVQQLARWRKDGHPVEVALNISRQQLLDAGFLRELSALVITHEVQPDWLVLEATERQSLLQDSACRRSLEDLSSAGFRLSLDDFGTGQSSFDAIADLPLHEIKIPMDLVHKTRSPRARHIVQAILDMSRNLNLESVAEGIENQELADILRDIGATKLQGYHYSRPLAPEATGEFLTRHTAALA